MTAFEVSDVATKPRPDLDDAKRRVSELMASFTTETTPSSATKTASYAEHLRPGTVVYITFLPGADYRDTVALAKRLRYEGFEPVPHFAARSIKDVAMLSDYLECVTGEAGVTRVLAIAGATISPAGEFSDSMKMLDTGIFDRYGIRTIGVAGHPEGSPDMSDAEALQAVSWKNAFAQRTDADIHIVTQFCFEGAPIIDWEKRLREAGNDLPIDIGIPGVATIKTLLSYAAACGIGNSMNFIKRQARNVAKLLRPTTPDGLVTDLADHVASDPESRIRGVHIYPLGGLRKTALWTNAVVDGEFEMNRNDRGFTVTVPLD